MGSIGRIASGAAAQQAWCGMECRSLQDVRILLLEDDALISIDAEDMLLSLGAARVLVAHTVEEAEAIVARERIDAAVLDLLIGSERCEEFAGRLAARPIPIVFASGFGDSGTLPEALKAVPTVAKPYSPQALGAALARALGSA
jgi:DNA-binding NtrC family response regulator